MKRLTFDGLFCDIVKCDSTPGGTFCESGTCTQRRVWERLKEYEDAGLGPEEIADFMKRWERAVEIAGLCKKGGIDHLDAAGGEAAAQKPYCIRLYGKRMREMGLSWKRCMGILGR